ncbi:MAG: hypothetical protein R3B09_33590 [Nannocystaceae bacterium]
MHTPSPAHLLVLALLAPSCGPAPDDDGDDATTTDATGDAGLDGPAEALALVESEAGTYEGSWELYGLDGADQPLVFVTWTDVAVATDPVLLADRAQLSVVDTMDYGGGQTGVQAWVEGVLLGADQGVGPRFIEVEGALTEFVELEPDHYTYETAITPAELGLFANVTDANLLEGHHTTDKQVSRPDGVETHTITRTTTLTYDAGEGPKQLEFVSLRGSHRKVP